MALQKKLKELGWFLSPESLESLTDNGEIKDARKIQSKALNMDLREISAGGLPVDITKGKVDFLTDPIVLQVMKVKNIAAPKVNEESKFAPRMLKIQFTDGVIQYSGIEIEPLIGLSVHTKPGTKVLLDMSWSPIENSQGLLLLKTLQVTVLGGNVEALSEKWELSQSMLKLSKSGRVGLSGGPPPFIAFANRIRPLATDKKGGPFKSLASKPVEKNENTEFASQRSSSIKDAIAEANRLGAKKNFGGGNKTLIDVNVQKIMDEGYSEQDAVGVLRIAKNNVRNALNILKNRDLDPNQQRPQRPPKKERGSKLRNDDDVPNTGAPTTKISLFDFLEDKLPVKETQPTFGGASKKQHSNDAATVKNPVKRFENNYSKYHYASEPPTTSANFREFENNISASFNRKTPNQSDNATKSMSNGNKYFNSHNDDSKSYKGANLRSGFKNENHNNRNDAGCKKPPPRNVPYPHTSAHESNQKSAEKAIQPQDGNRREDPKPKSANNNYRDNHNASQSTGAKYQSSSYEQKQALYENRSSDRGERAPRQQPSNNYGEQYRTRREIHVEPPATVGQAPFSNQIAKKPYNAAKTVNSAPPSKGPKSHPQMQQEIIGFQNSKTNEHAMNMLKTQQALESMTIQQKHSSASVPVSQAQTKPNEPNWAVGDKCMAKYWEDGKFYLAEITAVTKKTNVVHFLEYGNYEEILKKDCKPIMSNNYATPAGVPPIQQQQQQHLPPLQHQQHPSAANGPAYYQYQHQPQYYIQQNPSPNYGHKYQQQIYMPPNSRQ